MLFRISNPVRAASSQGIGRVFGALVALLVPAGGLDGIPTPERTGELTALLPGGELVVQPGGFPWLDAPDR
ncbi:hypothetical protein OG883_37290 [Streptomyces sp. NBC_01142]|uniref:hypothetical protein n=1 Tax=Streptomyces sp. NBC_01142 TaxID=2975865 RepID=UPI0022597C89|nr:hypothetical protein [Streptomyces sp. NBC_01142]MCX4825412.1 hypothetical protein [Streptomyces sp. NBC_01142]